MKITIITPGLLCTVQDLGRSGWRSAGVPPGGAADAWSHRLANLLVGNDDTAATLEIAGGNFRALVGRAGRLAVFGPGGELWIDGMPIGNGRPVWVTPGSEIDIRPRPEGNYTYLAAFGGWEVPVLLGSRSTCLAAGFGGLEGRALRKGDALATSSDDFKSSDEWSPATSSDDSRSFTPYSSDDSRSSTPYSSDDLESSDEGGAGKWRLPYREIPGNIIRVLPGPELGWWSAESRDRSFAADFTISTQRDRMGVRLEGPADLRNFEPAAGSMLSTAVMPGTVQIPPGGQPIVLLADAQTTGGYPRIAQVAAVDLPRLAQIPYGQTVRFQLISLAQSERLFLEREIRLRRIRTALSLKK